MTEADILYETRNSLFWVTKTRKAFEVYKTGTTHSTRCATIGLSLGLGRAIAEADRRQLALHNEKEGK